MKRLSALILSLLLLAALCACGTEEAPQKEQLEYYVQSRYVLQPTGDVNVTQYSYDENWDILKTETLLNGNFASAVEYVYNEDKTQLTMNYSSAIYEPYSTHQELSYDAEGRLIKITVIENGETSATSEYYYDEVGREIKVVSTAPGGYKSVIEHSYDKNGNILSYTISYIADSATPQSRQEYAYDADNRVASVSYYRNDALESICSYSYEGNVRYGTVCDQDGKVVSKLMEVLDEAGNVLECERYDANGTVQSYTCTVYACSNGSVSGKLPE